MFLVRSDKAQCTVAVVVIELDERSGPKACGMDIVEAVGREGRVVFGGSEESFRVGVVVANAASGVGGDDAQGVHEGVNGSGFERGAVVAVKDGWVGVCGDLFQEGSSLDKVARMGCVFFFPDFKGDDFAAEEVDDDIEFEEDAEEEGREPSDVPAPDLVGCGGGVGVGFFDGARGASAAAVGELFFFAQDAVEGRFGGDVAALVGEVDDDLGRWQ